MSFPIYTKSGDAGETALFGGKRVPKSHLRVDAYGTVDELNSFIGLLHDSLEQESIRQLLGQVQHRLFSIGAYLASDPNTNPVNADLESQDLKILEDSMDMMDSQLPELKNFILPGGYPTVSLCHVCRTVCRRAERLIVALHQETPVDAVILQFMNRLSDYFFMLARYLGKEAGAAEIIWEARKKT
ncbi:MAG: cob(I)yrinic acid a,c-diamide adenosyltransferase [Lewinellaceae bacterium]|nr:cob(I)yrinic acid a,c-diamide adenosyltransferase [Saprospiraceae bacterium]MCB9330583.1 cob(I)yrinic acid a,c-diamide adenosyltransferase [Lewinellaceae bacterium]